MVIGNGLLAKTFSNYRDDKEILIFASGVSNSTEMDSSKFKREFDLLKETITAYPKYKLVYFSTLSIEDESVKERPYIKHKLQLENYIKKNSSKYLIARVSNVVGTKGNSHTIINYLVNAVKNNIKIDIWSRAERNIIDVEDVRFIIEELLGRYILNRTVSVAMAKSVKVIDIIEQIEFFSQKKVNAIYIDKGEKLKIDTSDISKELLLIEEKKGVGIRYITGVLKKYYKQ